MTKPKTLELVELREVAKMLGTTSRQMLGWTRREDFPEPIANLKAVCWHRADIQRWAEEHKATLAAK